MPTLVGTARQCLTKEAAHALDEAVEVARSKGHVQTTSLHMVSSLLSLQSSALREACSRTSKNAYSTRVQLKALELCLGVSLDRLASTRDKTTDEPPVSNSLMAAIKRSQANQRRQPENFNFYQQQMQSGTPPSSSSSAISVVKVELQNLILSILDDPVVSRVFGEAGFRSCDIKLAILRPVHQIFKYSRYKGPPLFLCNLNDEIELNKRGFSFPFLGVSGDLERGENCRRIIEVMVRKKQGRNPLLLGISAYDALKGFLEMVEIMKGGDILPVELMGLGICHVENEILKFVNGDCDERFVKLKLNEVSRMVETCENLPGVIVNCGDLKGLICNNVLVDALRYVIHELGRLVEMHSGKVWLIAAAATHETYFKILNKFPTIENDLDFHILPITSLRPSMAEQSPRSSLMGSFVPFGGFFAMPSEAITPLSSSHLSVSRCHLCNEKCEREINALPKGGLGASIASRCQSHLPLWMQTVGQTHQGDSDAFQAKDDRMVLCTRIAGLQRKWDSICQHHHRSHLFPEATTLKLDCQTSSIVGFQSFRAKNTIDDSEHHTNASSTDDGCNNRCSSTSMDLLQAPSTNRSTQMNTLSYDNDDAKLSKIEHALADRRSTPLRSSSSAGNNHTSPTSATSVTTDLSLGVNSACTSKGLEKPADRTHSDPLQDSSGCFSANGDNVSGSISNNTGQSSFGTGTELDRQFDLKDFKLLYAALVERIGRQEAAINTISQTIARCKPRKGKRHGASSGGMWFNLHGSDTLAKKKLAIALSEILYGSRENLVCVDLSFHREMSHTNALLGLHVLDLYDATFRGKTVADCIAEKLSKRPRSVIFIENIDKADLQVQSNLLQAMKTGRFSDSHGREVGISNATFVTTAGSMRQGKTLSPVERISKYHEEDILTAKGWPIQMVIGFDLDEDATIGDLSMCPTIERDSSNPLMNKRKLVETPEHCASSEMVKQFHKASKSYLDLNFPAEDSESRKISSDNYGCNSVPESSDEWLKGFFTQFDGVVIFEPFNFDALAQEISMEIKECLNKIVSSECSLEIDKRVMVQMLAAAYFADFKCVENWVHYVLKRGFAEAQEKYSLSSRSIVKLVTRKGIHLDNQTPTSFLPARVQLQ